MTKVPLPKRGDPCGEWKVSDKLARGSYGEVWRAADIDGREVAIKFLRSTTNNAAARFRAEVQILNSISDITGVLPVLGSDLSAQLPTRCPWYAMPLAVPLTLAAKTFTVREKILAIEQIADTMTHLHARGISHRDIKPENILLFMNRSHICDFGCVTYPKKPPLTRDLRWVGPVWTMAPEVRRNDTKADPMPADVYSLAKTLWITLTGTVKGFDGQYSGDGTLSIRSTCEDLYVTPIEELLVTSTDHLPSKRPTMYEFTKALRGWLSLSAEYQQCNTLRWKDALHKLFPFAVPARATWHRIDAIVRVLNNIGSIRGLSTLIFPDGGRTDFGRIVRSECDGDYIELCADDAIVVKPSRLIFESLSDDPRWSYFRLECIEADPRKDRPVLEELRLEEGMDIGGTKPMELSASEETPYTGELLRESGCRAHRRLGGVLIICQNTSQFDIRS